MDLVSQHQSDERRNAGIRSVDIHDCNSIDWSGVRRIVYQVQQRFCYRYAAPIYKLRQRLVVVPRPVHGNQRLLSHRLEVSQSRLRKRMCEDRFGNVVFGISIAKVEEAVDFDVSLIAEHVTGRRPHLQASPRQAPNVCR